MKRLLLILLLIALPYQSSWAEVAVYCQHEEASSFHFGHHEHQHELAQTDSEHGDNSIELHADCSTCHGLAAAVPSPLPSEPISAPSVQAYLGSTSQIKSLLPVRPEKPKWGLAV